MKVKSTIVSNAPLRKTLTFRNIGFGVFETRQRQTFSYQDTDMSERVIYLDMDEVIVDFVDGALSLFGKDKSCKIPGEWLVSEWIGITHAEMWKAIDAAGLDFWLNLKPYPWAKELVTELESLCPVVIASTPSRSSLWSMSGKVGWLQNFYQNPTFTDYVLIRDKWRLSHERTLLIDDRPKNCERFAKRPDKKPSGDSILFPAEWHDLVVVEDRVEYVIERVKAWIENG